ncbi:MAG: P-type DNA transfer protein VirB5 [Sphingobium sp.]
MHHVKAALFATVVALSPVPAFAQYAVIDYTSITKQVEQIAQLKQQLQTLQQQLTQMQKLYDSANGLTNMGDIASVLNQSSTRKALPENFSEVESLLSGSGSGTFGTSATKFLNGNSLYTTSANDYYAQALSKVQKSNAGELTLGEQMYEAASKRLDGLETLRKQISQAADQKTVAALSARIQSESALLQNDMLRMQALKMVQDAQSKVDDQRARENWREKLDSMKDALN